MWARFLSVLSLLWLAAAIYKGPVAWAAPLEDPAPVPTRVEIGSAPVGVLYSPATSRSLGWRWEWEWSGCANALKALGVEYEVLSPEQLGEWNGQVLILANTRNMSQESLQTIRSKEIKILATYMASYRSESNTPWEGINFALGDRLGVRFQSWIGFGERARSLKVDQREIPLGRGQAMLVESLEGARILGQWPGGEAAIVEGPGGIYVGEDLFCPENSDSKPVLEELARLLNRLQPGLARMPTRMSLSKLPDPPASRLAKSGRTVRVGLERLQREAVLRAPERLVVNGSDKLKFHRWLPGTSVEVSGEPYLEVLRLQKNGTYQWRAYRGTLNIAEDGTLLNILDFEEYLAGVVPGEVPAYYPEESLKAMAVVARTYGLSHLGRHQGYDVCDTVHCQVYNGLGQEAAPTSQAVAATAGEILSFEGQPAKAFFHAVCGGHTAASTEAWPNGAEAPPYLTGIDDELYCSESGRYRWQEEYSARELTEKMRAALKLSKPDEFVGLSSFSELRVSERSRSGRVKALEIISPEATYRVEGDSIRWLFSGGKIGTAGLQSTFFELERSGDRYLFKGGGWGHGVGLCQQGSAGRAKAGQTYDAILSHYYPHTALLSGVTTTQARR